MNTEFGPSASIETLRLRSRILQQLRSFFLARGFFEVETPVLSADTVVDLHLDPLRVTLFDDPRDPKSGRELFMQTSPEFAMKRLLAAGADAIFQITRAFRGAEVGELHNPEFTMVEWYRVGDDMDAGIHLLSDLTKEMLGAPAAQRLTYQDAFQQFAGIDPLEADVNQLKEAAIQRGLDPQAFTCEKDEILNVMLAELVEPHLGEKQPTILYNYPASQSALARVSGDDNRVAERFELYVGGIELANGYHELLDAEELMRRNREINKRRVTAGKPPLQEDSRMLSAMRNGLPACAGVALGFDRLMMIISGAKSIRSVMSFTIDRA